MANHLILGATGSTGSALARQLTSAGHRVLLAGRDEEKLRPLAEELDGPFAVCTADNGQSIEAAFQQAIERFGELHGAANCIGSVLLKPAHLTSEEEFQATLTVNLHSAFATVRAAARSMRGGGSIVLFSSAAADIGVANHEAIAAAKAGVEGLTRSAAATYAPKGIRFNALSPGLVRSEMTQRIWSNETAAQTSLAMHALGKFGEPDQVAALAAWLLDPANDWITGQVIGIDGGLSRVLPRK